MSRALTTLPRMPSLALVPMHCTSPSPLRLTSRKLQQLSKKTQNSLSSRLHPPPSHSRLSHCQHPMPRSYAILPLEYLAPWFPVSSGVQCSTHVNALHSLSHPGIRATQRLITAHYVWPGINSVVRKWARSCLQCQRSKVQWHTTASLTTFATPDARFDRIRAVWPRGPRLSIYS